MRIVLSQETYDTLVKRLSKNHHAHYLDSPFDQICRTLTRDAQTGKEGVSVRRATVEIARRALAQNIKLAGKKYQSGYDEILLLWLDDALDGAECEDAPAEVQPRSEPTSASPETPLREPQTRAAQTDPTTVDGWTPPFDLSQLPDCD